jgi:hypothetical protein
VVLNVTAVPGSFGFVTVHPRGSALPNASNLNHQPGGVVANAVIARVGRGGDICVFTSGASDVIVDVAGLADRPTAARAGGLCPSLTPTDRSRASSSSPAPTSTPRSAPTASPCSPVTSPPSRTARSTRWPSPPGPTPR